MRNNTIYFYTIYFSLQNFYGVSQNLDTEKYSPSGVNTQQHLVIKKPTKVQLSIIVMQGFVPLCYKCEHSRAHL